MTKGSRGRVSMYAMYAAKPSTIATAAALPSSAGRRQAERAGGGRGGSGGGFGVRTSGEGWPIRSAITWTSLPNSSSAWSPVQPTSRAA